MGKPGLYYLGILFLQDKILLPFVFNEQTTPLKIPEFQKQKRPNAVGGILGR